MITREEVSGVLKVKSFSLFQSNPDLAKEEHINWWALHLGIPERGYWGLPKFWLNCWKLFTLNSLGKTGQHPKSLHQINPMTPLYAYLWNFTWVHFNNIFYFLILFSCQSQRENLLPISSQEENTSCFQRKIIYVFDRYTNLRMNDFICGMFL